MSHIDDPPEQLTPGSATGSSSTSTLTDPRCQVPLDSDLEILNLEEPSPRFETEIRTELPVSFSVKYSPGIFDPGNEDLLEHGTRGHGARRLVVLDSKVEAHYGERITKYFQHFGIEHRIISVDCNESNKNLDTLLLIMRGFEDFGLIRRNEPIIIVGGGVLLDVAGLAASVYRRGVPYIRVPTTLLGLVDASVGAKVAINCFERRNRMGAYYPPVASYLDRAFLRTLDRQELSNGLAEILKMGIIKNYELFCLLEEHGGILIDEKFQRGAIPLEVIRLAIEGMVEELEPNLWERDLERLVDFGHSFSPMIEMRALPELSHGQAVTLDMLFSAILSNQRGLLSLEELSRIYATAKFLELPTFHPLFADPKALEEGLADTVRHRNGRQNLAVPTRIGTSTFLNDVSREEIANAAKIFARMSDESHGT